MLAPLLHTKMNFNQKPDPTRRHTTNQRLSDQELCDSIPEILPTASNLTRRSHVRPYRSLLQEEEKAQALNSTAQNQPNPSGGEVNELPSQISASSLINRILSQEERIQALHAARQQQFRLLNSNTNVLNQSTNDVFNETILQQQSIYANSMLRRGLLEIGPRDNSHTEQVARIQTNVANDVFSQSLLAASSLGASSLLQGRGSMNIAPFGLRQQTFPNRNDPTHAAILLQPTMEQTTPQPQPQPSAGLSLAPSKEKGRPSLFAQKLHQMLLDLERLPGGSDIASFLPNGRAFKIHEPKKFMEEIIPKYFSMRRMESLKRQLASYNFQQIPTGPDRGAYYNEFFIREQPELCTRIRRIVQQPKKFRTAKR